MSADSGIEGSEGILGYAETGEAHGIVIHTGASVFASRYGGVADISDLDAGTLDTLAVPFVVSSIATGAVMQIGEGLVCLNNIVVDDTGVVRFGKVADGWEVPLPSGSNGHSHVTVIGAVTVGQELLVIYVQHTYSLFDMGSIAAARDTYRAARDNIQAYASQITDPQRMLEYAYFAEDVLTEARDTILGMPHTGATSSAGLAAVQAAKDAVTAARSYASALETEKAGKMSAVVSAYALVSSRAALAYTAVMSDTTGLADPPMLGRNNAPSVTRLSPLVVAARYSDVGAEGTYSCLSRTVINVPVPTSTMFASTSSLRWGAHAVPFVAEMSFSGRGFEGVGMLQAALQVGELFDATMVEGLIMSRQVNQSAVPTYILRALGGTPGSVTRWAEAVNYYVRVSTEGLLTLAAVPAPSVSGSMSGVNMTGNVYANRASRMMATYWDTVSVTYA